MQRYYEIVRDTFGNLAAGCTVEVFPAGSTSTYSTIYPASYNGDTPTTAMDNPFTTASDGQVAFAAADGDNDIKISGSNLPATLWRYRVNLFDSTTSTTIPVSSISLSMPAEFSVSGSPGTNLSVTKATEAANTVWAGPTSGGAVAPAFRALHVNDVTPVACAISGVQTIAGAKTFSSGIAAAGVTSSTTLTVAGASQLDGDVTFNANIDLAQSTTFTIEGGASNGWRSVYGQFMETSVPALVAISSTVAVPGFVDAATTAMRGTLIVPFGYKDGSSFYPFVQWAASNTNTGAVRWGLEYTLIKSSNQGLFPASTTIYVEPTASAGAVNQLYLSEFASVSGSGVEPDTVIAFRIFREGAHANDTFTGTALFCGFGIHCQQNRVGPTKNRVPPFYA